MTQNLPKVGVGVIVVNKEGNILIGKRRGGHAQYFSIPGGHIEIGETFEQAAVRELKEEANISIKNPHVIAVTNNLETYRKEGVHSISIILLAIAFTGEVQNMEPKKCDGWDWYDPKSLPQPHFDASQMGVACYLKKNFYEKTI